MGSIRAVVAAAGLALACTSARTPAPAEGAAAGVVSPAPAAVEPVRVWITPKGRRVVGGSVDRGGWVLPLDVVRPPASRAPDRPDRALAPAAPRGPGPFEETRLGPDDAHSENETSIAVDGATVVAGWNSFTDTGLAMGVARSADAGETWDHELFDGHTTMSDPAVAAGGDGRWYYGYIANGGATGSDYDVFVRRSIDDGETWLPPVAVTVDANFDDKPYIAARGDEVLVAYADFGVSPAKVHAARSIDGGLSFQHDTVLAVASVGGNGASPVIAADGTYYVFWRDSFQDFLWFSRSDDQGETWSPDASIVEMNPLPSTLQPGGFRMVNLPVAAANPIDGSLVVVWNDQRFGDPDVLAVRSDDRGETWSEPVRANDDVGTAAQFLPWLAFDAAGRLHVVWYDRRHDPAEIDVYYARSSDGGASFEPNVRITAEGFLPVLPTEPGASPFIGDYNAIAAGPSYVYPFYQDARRGEQDVWVARLPTVLFADGFESGGTEAWSAAFP
jgi:hypothetical protein